MPRQSRKLQKGGYYFAIYDGVRAAGLLMPVAVRQGWRLLSNSNKSRRNKTKARKNQRKTRKNPRLFA